ncbi:MAG: cell surface protein [Christensenellaceae bacterium]|jgi:hypothetical protein|nr:cell surface protein [Christensenellaceae bacterium]
MITKKITFISFILILLFLFSFGILMINPQRVYAKTVRLNSLNSVDSGKHLDWGGKSNYMPQFTDAIKTWENHKSGIIRKDTIFIVEDVTISDYYEISTIVAISSSNGKIKFNQYNMDSNTNAQNQNVCTAMIGYHLGLGVSDYYKDVMYTYTNSVIALSENDIASFDEAFKRY